MLELNFKIEENDGRNRCASIAPWDFLDRPVRCCLEKDHSMDHGANGRTWTDEQERKVKTMRDKWGGHLVRAIGLAMWVLSYWVIQVYFNSDHRVPLAVLLGTLTMFAVVFVVCAGWIIADVREKVQQKNGK